MLCNINHDDEYMGKKIFIGLQETFLHLLTPNIIQTSDNENFVNSQRRHQDAVRNKFENLRKEHLDAVLKDPTYNPDASNYFKFIPKYITSLTIGETYNLENPCYQVC